MSHALPNHKTIGCILLAAGNSSRLGQSKQQLPIDGQPLLVRSVEVLLHAGLGRVVVVLGADAYANRKLLTSLPVEIVNNKDWAKGMGNSLKAGLRQLQQGSVPEAIILSVCDQPYLSTTVIISLIEHFQLHECDYVASAYGDTLGPPALFGPAFYDRLGQLPDAAGAKKLFDGSGEAVDFPEGIIDIDTPDDYLKVKGGKKPAK